MLKDTFNRAHDYLRVSVTDKCNLRCRYCMPEEGVRLLPHAEILRHEEVLRLIGIFTSLGVVKVRFTGGEPLVRKGFSLLMEETRSTFPDVECAVTTNGVLLDGFLDDFRRIGVRKLNISLDSLSRDRYRDITRSDSFDRVIANIEEAMRSGFFEIKINVVLSRGTLGELDLLLDYFCGRPATVRFIERMPFVEAGEGEDFVSSTVLLDELAARGTLTRVAKSDTRVARKYDFACRGSSLRIGVIPPLTHRFCGNCNRLRLTADGRLKTCLVAGGDVDLKTPLRGGASDEDMRSLIIGAVRVKGEGHSFPVSGETGTCGGLPGGFMSGIGG